MVKKAQSGDVNKSGAIEELLRQNPKIKASEVVTTLGARGLKFDPSLVYYVKGKMKGQKGRRVKYQRHAEPAMTNGGESKSTGTGEVLATIKKVTGLATEVGGMKKLKALIEALSQ